MTSEVAWEDRDIQNLVDNLDAIEVERLTTLGLKTSFECANWQLDKLDDGVSEGANNFL